MTGKKDSSANTHPVKKTSDYKDLSPEEAMNVLGTSPDGLQEAEAERRLQTFGYNKITEKKKSPAIEFLSKFWGAIPWLLEFTVVLSVFLGHYLEGGIILFLLIINAGISLWNEKSSQKALELLKNKLSVQTRVLRNGKWGTLESSVLVPGDIVTLGIGDIVTTDVKIISDDTLSSDQSAITGESMPVTLKQSSITYSGSIIKRGEAQAVVLNTGKTTYFGKTIELVGNAKTKSHQQEIMMSVVKYMMYAAIAAALVVSADAFLVRAGFITILTIILIFLMGAIPYALPSVFSVVLASGAIELSAKKRPGYKAQFNRRCSFHECPFPRQNRNDNQKRAFGFRCHTFRRLQAERCFPCCSNGFKRRE